jgi:hypothetical protein
MVEVVEVEVLVQVEVQPVEVLVLQQLQLIFYHFMVIFLVVLVKEVLLEVVGRLALH